MTYPEDVQRRRVETRTEEREPQELAVARDRLILHHDNEIQRLKQWKESVQDLLDAIWDRR